MSSTIFIALCQASKVLTGIRGFESCHKAALVKRVALDPGVVRRVDSGKDYIQKEDPEIYNRANHLKPDGTNGFEIHNRLKSLSKDRNVLVLDMVDEQGNSLCEQGVITMSRYYTPKDMLNPIEFDNIRLRYLDDHNKFKETPKRIWGNGKAFVEDKDKSIIKTQPIFNTELDKVWCQDSFMKTVERAYGGKI